MKPSTLGLRQQLLLIALLPMLLIAIVLAAYFTVSGLAALDEEQADRGRAIASYLAPAAEYGVISGNREGLQSLVQATLTQRDVQAVTITDPAGRVLAVSGRTALSPAMLLSLPGDPKQGLVRSGERRQAFAATIRRSRAEIEDYLDAASSRTQTPDTMGWVFVELSGDELADRKRTFLVNSVLLVILGLTLTGALALRLARRVVGPVDELVAAVRRMAEGALDTRVAADSGGELGDLERGFNNMAVRLEDVHRTMQERIDSATAQLSHQARHDALTGLINRRAFEDRAELAVQTAGTQGCRHVLCFLDLDQFKVVNDTCGHAAGDDLLRQLSLLLRGRIRGHDTLARLGGDEFGVLLENCELEDAQRVAESLRQLVEDFRFFWHDKVFTVGVSIGLVTVDEQTHTLHEVLAAADRACYIAKEQGRNRVEVFRPDAQTQQRRNQDGAWGQRITHALNEQRLMLHAQPLFALDGGPPPDIAAELLLRMQDDGGELIMPMAFLPAAERFALLPTLDGWALEHALQHIARHPESDDCYSLNVAAGTVCDEGYTTRLAEGLTRHHVAGARLCFDLSEATVGRNYVAAQRFTNEVRALGCRVALDAFGGGMSSFNVLQNLAPDYVKIGGSLIRDAIANEVSLTLLRAIIDVARNLGIGVIAETLEQADMRDLVMRLGVSWGQGYLLGRPVPLEHFLLRPRRDRRPDDLPPEACDAASA